MSKLSRIFGKLFELGPIVAMLIESISGSGKGRKQKAIAISQDVLWFVNNSYELQDLLGELAVQHPLLGEAHQHLKNMDAVLRPKAQ